MLILACNSKKIVVLKDNNKTTDSCYFPLVSEKIVQELAKCREFPISACKHLIPNDSLESFENQWYSRELARLNEPVLYNQISTGKNIIRVTQLGWFTSSFTLEQKDGVTKGKHTRRYGEGGYWGKNKKDFERKNNIDKHNLVNAKNWDMVVNKIKDIDFYNIQTADTIMILDGERYILEVLMDDKYHFVTRTGRDFTYEKDLEFAELCSLIQQLCKN